MILSFRKADLLPAFKSRRSTFSLQIAVFDEDGNGADAIDVVFVDSDGRRFEPSLNLRTRLIYDAVFNLVSEYARSFDADIINIAIDPKNERYGFKPHTKPGLFQQTAIDFATKLRAAIPYYFSGITLDGVNDAGSFFMNIQIYEPKHAHSENVSFEHEGQKYSGVIRGFNGEGIYTLDLSESHPNVANTVKVSEDMLQ